MRTWYVGSREQSTWHLIIIIIIIIQKSNESNNYQSAASVNSANNTKLNFWGFWWNIDPLNNDVIRAEAVELHVLSYIHYSFNKLFLPFFPICSRFRLYICYLGEFVKNKTHRFQCSSVNDAIIKTVSIYQEGCIIFLPCVFHCFSFRRRSCGLPLTNAFQQTLVWLCDFSNKEWKALLNILILIPHLFAIN